MPCSDGRAMDAELERRLAAERAAEWQRLDDELRVRLDAATRAACELCRWLVAAGVDLSVVSAHVAGWWAAHEAEDRARDEGPTS